MNPITLSATRLREQVETKAYAYGVSPVVSTLLGEYVVDLLRQESRRAGHANAVEPSIT